MSTDNRTRGRRSAVDYAQQDQTKQDGWDRESEIEDLIERCSRALGRGSPKHYRYVADKLSDSLIPLLEDHTDESILDLDGDLDDHDGWDYTAVSRFLDKAYDYEHTFNGQYDVTPVASRDQARETIEKTLRSVTAVAEHESIVLDSYDNRVDTHGFSGKIGEHLQDEKYDFGDPVYGVSWQAGGLKTLFGGGTGQAKSTSTETEVEDLYRYDPETTDANLRFLPSTPFKVIDLADLEKGENWFYDIAQRQEVLREIREEKGEPADFTEMDEDIDRQIEIYAPLTPSLSDFELPHDVTDPDDPEPIVKPFVVPANDIPRDIFMTCIQERVSKDQMRSIRHAYDTVDRERDDWAIKDLANEIRSRDELSDKHKADAIGALRALQDEGFIRTSAHEHTLDWERIFHETDTVTLFTQAERICESDVGQMLCIAYLLDKMLRLRGGGGMYGLPESVLVVRELWDVVPHKQRERSNELAAAIQEVIGEKMARGLRRNRHYGMNFVCDTQAPYDLLNSVRELFNRYVIFNGTYKLVDGVFSWTSNNKSNAFAGTLTSKRGQAGVVGEVQPAIDHDWAEFISPLEYVPPSHHHYDKETDQSGWHARCKYLTPVEECSECGSEAVERSDDGRIVTCLECDEETVDLSLGRNEELRASPWDGTIPESLEIEAYSHGDDEDEEGEDGEDVDPKTLHRSEARNRRRNGESYRSIRDNIPNNLETGKPYALRTIQDWTEDIDKGCANHTHASG
ncbi:hypothetical protein [Halomontanus rarus]|uniref:hypothetical protein n=1 Tax=Halomontanus rarus TaxID=3034020 RepID=UPI00307C2C51